MNNTKNGADQMMELTSENIKKQLVLFSIPFLGTLLQQLYNIIDTAVAGRLGNDSALSAIGVSVPIYLLFISIILGFAIGITILLTQFFGAKQFEQIKRLIATMSIFCWFGACNGGWGSITYKATIADYKTKTPNELLEIACIYLRVVFLGIPFSILYNLLGAIMRSYGETNLIRDCLPYP